MTTDAPPAARRAPPDAPADRWRSAAIGARRGLAIAVGSALFGILYGAACVGLDLSPTLAVASSVLVFSGAVQFAVLGMLDGPASAAAVALTSALVSLRLVLMGGSLSGHLTDSPKAGRLAAVPLLTDASWAAVLAETRPVDRLGVFAGAGACVLVFWTAGTAAGTALGGALPPGADRSLAFSGVVFLVLLALVAVRVTGASHAPWLAAALAAILAGTWVPEPAAMLVGVAAGAAAAWRRTGPAA